MKKPTYRTNDAPRVAQPASGQPIGWLQPIKAQISRLRNELQGLELRVGKQLGAGEPAAIVGKRTFLPDDSYTFAFDYLQDGTSSVQSQYVVRDGITYEIPIVMPPPGLMLMRSMQVKLYQRVFVPNVGPMQVPMNYGNYFLGDELYQTCKFSFPDNSSQQASITSRRMSFMWNLVDTKSGAQFSDELVSDQAFLPQGIGVSATALFDLQQSAGTTGRYLEFDAPWLFERDAQLTFFFRPINPVIQPTASSGYMPYSFDDREQNGLVRNSAVTVQIELHGTRYVDEQDARREGARIE